MREGGRRIRLDLAYDGTDFAGWQVQPGLRTVQGVVEEALSRVCRGVGVRVRGAGRTDRGVHARGQVADAWLPSPLDDRRLLRALGALLPRDVRPLGVVSVEQGFHARRDAASKTYAYWLDCTAYGDPFLRRFAHHEPAPLDLEAIREALAVLPGRRDFSAFAGTASRVEDRVRTLIEARLDVERPDLWVFRFTADGFLNRMVRNLVGTLLEIGRGRIPPARIADMLASKDRRQAGPTAPACGLVLEKVSYPGPDKSDPPLAADRSAGWCRMAPFRSRGAP